MIYDSSFYERNMKYQETLGLRIIPFLVKMYYPKSIIDFGCGSGLFLKTLSDKSDADYIGLNFDTPSNLIIDRSKFISADFSKPINLERKFNLVISLEVAEHIDIKSADIFIDSLVNHSKGLIMFSAATPGQGGENHINEQPHEFWHVKFGNYGFKKCDIIRPIIKDDKTVPFWYRNNIFIYERGEK